jgi:hypothetical protein
MWNLILQTYGVEFNSSNMEYFLVQLYCPAYAGACLQTGGIKNGCT